MFDIDFTVLEARSFESSYGGHLMRSVKDYEIDMECTSGRMYSYDTLRAHRLSFGDVLVRKPHGIVSAEGPQNSYLLTLDFSKSSNEEIYSRNLPGKAQAVTDNELIVRLAPIIHPSNVNDIAGIYRRLIALPNRNSPISKELVCELIYILNAEISKKNYEILKPQESVIETIMLYMQEHLGGRVTLDDLSRLVHLEKSYLLRLFRSETGKTPIEMLIKMRLDKASDLIATTDLNVCEIAAECGYNTVSFFISAYKKRYGITPEANRRMIREN